MKKHIRPRVSVNKIVSPQVANVFLRERCFKYLDKLAQKLIWLSGPAGAGKTTLISSYLERDDQPVLWYQVDETDRDIASYFYHLTLGVRLLLNDDSIELPTLMLTHQPHETTIFTRNFAREMIALLPENTVLVLDNYQDANDEAFDQVVSVLLSEFNSQCFILSRGEPPAPILKLRLERRLAALDEYFLRLSEEECRGILLLHLCDFEISEGELKKLHRETNGWVAGLILLIEQARTFQFKNLFSQYRHKLSFDYFANEVFDKAPSEVQTLLLRTAFLPKISPDVARKLTESDNAEKILTDLRQRNYFTTLHADGQYEYHPLFREFLLNRVKLSMSLEDINSLMLSSAQALLDAGEYITALEQLVQTQQYDLAVKTILSLAPHLLREGRIITLRKWIQYLPDDMPPTIPWLQYWLAVTYLGKDWQAAQLLFDSALHRFEELRDVTGMYMAWCGAVEVIHLSTTRFNDVPNYLDLFIRLQEQYPDIPDLKTETAVASSLISALAWTSPKHPLAEKWLARGEVLLMISEEPYYRENLGVAMALYFTYAGQPQRAVEILSEKIAYKKENQLSTVAAKAILTFDWFLIGEPSRALISAKNGIAISNKLGIYSLQAMLYCGGLYALFYYEDLSQIEGFLAEIKPLLPEGHISMGHAHFELVLAWKNLVTKDFEQAAYHGKRACDISNQFGSCYQKVASANAYVATLYAQEKYEEADILWEQNREYMEEMGFNMGAFICDYIRAYYDYKRGFIQKAVNRIRDGIIPKHKQGIMLPSLYQREITRNLYGLCLKYDIEADYIRELIKLTDLQPTTDTPALEKWPYAIRIYLFGNLEIIKYSESINFGRKEPKKPLALLKCLIAFGGYQVSVEKIIQALWPECEADARQTFNTTLHRLRQLLDQRAFVLEDGKLSLNTEMVWVDYFVIQNLIQSAFIDLNKNVLQDETVQKIVKLYKGDFLEREIDTIWLLSPREIVKNRLINLFQSAAQHYFRTAQHKFAISLLKQVILIEPVAETSYQLMMQCHLSLNQKAEGLKIYQTCRQALHHHLGTTPSAKTEQLRAELQSYEKQEEIVA